MGKRGKFLLGALVGAGLGVLFAPKKGSEVRKELKVKFADLLEKAKEIDASEVADLIETRIEDLKKELNDLDKEKALAVAKKKANEIKDKAEELVEIAIRKGTPILKDAAIEVRDKAIIVAKEMIEKLEQQDNEGKKNKESK